MTGSATSDSSSVNGSQGEITGFSSKRISESILLISVIIASFLVRLYILSSSPSFSGTADAGSWAALAREIRGNSFLIPSINTIHYPGSSWIYPPVIPYLLALISLITGENGLSLSYGVGMLMIIFQVATLLPIYFTVKRYFGVESAAISSLIFVAFPPFLYLITWSALPQITAFLVLSLIIWKFSLIQTETGYQRRSLVVISILSFLIVFIHDLTVFVYLYMLFVSIIYFLISDRWNGTKENRNLVLTMSVALISSIAGIAIWYGTRVNWLMQTLSIAGSSTGSLSSILSETMVNLAQPLAVPYYIYWISLLLLPLSFVLITLHFTKFSKKDRNVMLLFSYATLALTLIAFPFPMYFIRLTYFLTFLYLFFAPYVVYMFIQPLRKEKRKEISRAVKSGAGAFAVFLVIFVVLYSSWSVAFSYTAHSYYLSSGTSGPGDIVNAGEWIQSNVNSSDTIAADGYTGFFIMGYTGNPVIDHINSSMLTQLSEVNESNAAYVLTENPGGNINNTIQVIRDYNVSYVVTNLTSSQVPGFYFLVYSYGGIDIYRIHTHILVVP